MFGWCSRITCPIPELSRQWVERRMAWVSGEFGSDLIRGCEIILPTETYFPDPYDADNDDSAEAMFDRVCRYLELDRARFRLRLVQQRPAMRQDGILSTEATAAGTYQHGDWQHAETICVERSALADPMQLVAVMAHELCHAHLLGDGRVSQEEEDHEPLTDLLTICMGMGIFGANASVRDFAWSDGRQHGWSVSSHGYLHQDTWAYALAVSAWVRGELQPKWIKHLRPDVRKTFKSAERYLAKHGVQERSLLD